MVVTGLGALTCLGRGAQTMWSRLVAGHNGIRRIQNFDSTDMPIQIAGEVDRWDPVVSIGAEWAASGERMSQFAVAAAVEAVENAGLDIDGGDLEEAAVIISNAHGDWGIGVPGIVRVSVMDGGPAAYYPEDFWQRIFYHAPAYVVARRLQAFGPHFAISTACASGAKSVERAVRWIRRGQAPLAVAGGSETVVDQYGVQFLHTMKALAYRSNDTPETASRPFDLDRSGFVVAEGAGVLVLESLEHARDRGAEIIAEVVGVGGSANANSLFAPEDTGEGPCGSIRAAMRDGEIDPSEIDCIFAHATATGVGDPAEAEAFRMVFGQDVGRISITATKSMMGHAIGASGALATINAVQSIRDGVIPPIINLDRPDPCTAGLRLVRGGAESRSVRGVVMNAFGFGGINASVIVRRFDG